MATALEQGIEATNARISKPPSITWQLPVLQEPHNISAWLWLSYVVDDQKRKKECLERVLRIDPYNQSAHVGLSELEKPQPLLEQEVLPERSSGQRILISN